MVKLRDEFYDDKRVIVAVSGGFDPIHIGHVRYIQEASKYGEVVVILNSDSWLKRKKNYSFQKWEERAEILRSIRGVKDVIMASDADNTVCRSLDNIRPDYFAKGGDRDNENTPEVALCDALGIKILWNMGGGKVQSSQELVNAAR